MGWHVASLENTVRFGCVLLQSGQQLNRSAVGHSDGTLMASEFSSSYTIAGGLIALQYTCANCVSWRGACGMSSGLPSVAFAIMMLEVLWFKFKAPAYGTPGRLMRHV